MNILSPFHATFAIAECILSDQIHQQICNKNHIKCVQLKKGLTGGQQQKQSSKLGNNWRSSILVKTTWLKIEVYRKFNILELSGNGNKISRIQSDSCKKKITGLNVYTGKKILTWLVQAFIIWNKNKRTDLNLYQKWIRVEIDETRNVKITQELWKHQ